MAETNVNWDYPLMQTTMDAKGSRPSVVKPNSYRLTGADGSIEGTLRPFPGFREVHQFNISAWSVATAGQHDETSQILDDLQPINFTIHNEHYGYGFVYRVRRKNNGPVADLFLDYYNSYLGRWIRGQVIKLAVPLTPVLSPYLGQPMKVVVTGRLIYIFIKNSEPILMYVQRETPFGMRVITNTGPGLRPTMIDPANYVALGSIITTGDADRPGAGQVVLLSDPPSVTGLMPAPVQDEATLPKLDAGDYAFAYILHNSQTGKRSSLSEIAEARKALFDPDNSGVLDVVPLFAAMEICYDSSQYDQAYIYRSVRVQDAGGTYIAGILHLDAIIDLATYHTVNNPLASNRRQSLYYYELKDKELVFQDVFQDATLHDQNMPKGGAAAWYETILVVGDIKTSGESVTGEIRTEDAVRGVGEIRWSTTSDVSPELFPPQNRAYPALTSNDVITFRQAGPNLIGFSRDRQYLLRKEDVSVRVLEMHEGYGVINSRCAETIGSQIYFITPKGVKSVDSQGQLDDVRAINDFIQRVWANDHEYLHLAHDPAMSCAFVLNTRTEECCLFWFSTAKVTHLRDTNFAGCVRGVWPQNFTFDLASIEDVNSGGSNFTYKNTLTERVFFWMNAPSANCLGFKFRLFVADYERKRVRSLPGQPPETTMLPLTYHAVFRVNETYAAPNITFDLTSPDALGDILPLRCWGAKLYVVKATDKTLEGKSVTINTVTVSGVEIVSADVEVLAGLGAGDVVAISPVYFEWQGSPLGTQTEEAMQFGPTYDFFMQKAATSCVAAFAGVTRPEEVPASLMRFQGAIYRGTETTALSRVYPTNPDGSDVQSVEDREGCKAAAFGKDLSEGAHGVSGAVLTPAIIIIVPNIGFELLGVSVAGEVRRTRRDRR